MSLAWNPTEFTLELANFFWWVRHHKEFQDSRGTFAGASGSREKSGSSSLHQIEGEPVTIQDSRDSLETIPAVRYRHDGLAVQFGEDLGMPVEHGASTETKPLTEVGEGRPCSGDSFPKVPAGVLNPSPADAALEAYTPGSAGRRELKLGSGTDSPCQAHNLEIAGSTPAPATKFPAIQDSFGTVKAGCLGATKTDEHVAAAGSGEERPCSGDSSPKECNNPFCQHDRFLTEGVVTCSWCGEGYCNICGFKGGVCTSSTDPMENGAVCSECREDHNHECVCCHPDIDTGFCGTGGPEALCR